jgi:hypothetical protein
MVVEDLLRLVATDVLISKCRRNGLREGHRRPFPFAATDEFRARTISSLVLIELFLSGIDR